MLSQSLYLNSCTSLGDCLFASESPCFAHMHNRLSFEPLSTLASTLKRTFTAPRWISADSSLRSSAVDINWAPTNYCMFR